MREALQPASNPSRFWFRFVDDTWVIQRSTHKQEDLVHINSIDPAIKFTVEGTQGNGGIPFLDTLITPEAANPLTFMVYHKPTHTDQYLQLDSHHNLSAKYSVIGTLTHMAKQFILNQSYSRRNYHTLEKPWLNANTHPGP